ncbi:hypothetical protein C2G38_2093317 [Gigaspora rosea]|uniref:Uncharacterized protein n=1 Tax=Gigaspora rosea TaxID=44941 RepID=A0A397V1C3_9GLOM|nr:hypothetical protein C2G38_2093317 [Gigaspora rosea]
MDNKNNTLHIKRGGITFIINLDRITNQSSRVIKVRRCKQNYNFLYTCKKIQILCGMKI